MKQILTILSANSSDPSVLTQLKLGSAEKLKEINSRIIVTENIGILPHDLKDWFNR